MKTNNYDSYCGIYCGACDIQLADKSGNKSKFASFWSEKNIETYQLSQGFTYETKDQFVLRCDGCKSEEVFINCRICKIRECARIKNVEHCTDCKDYKCELFTSFDQGSSILPHLSQAQENLKAVKNIGTENWYENQKKKWSCPTCQTPFSWYSIKCQECGTDLKKHSYGNFSWIRAFLFKLGLNLMARKQKSTDK